MNDDVRTRLNQAAVGVGLGYVAWSVVSFVYECPIIAALFCLGFIVLSAFAGAAFHELAFLLWWFICMFTLIGIGGLFIAGRTITGLFALFGLIFVLAIMENNGVIHYLHNGIETEESREQEHFGRGCWAGSTYSLEDGYCHRQSWADPVLPTDAIYAPLDKRLDAPMPGALDNIARKQHEAMVKTVTPATHWNHPNGQDFMVFGIVAIGVVLYHLLAPLFRRPKRIVDEAQFQSAMAAYDRIGFADPRRKEIERRVRRQLGS